MDMNDNDILRRKEKEEFDEEIERKLKRLWTDHFSPRALWASFKIFWPNLIIWFAFFFAGFYLASQYYEVACNKAIMSINEQLVAKQWGDYVYNLSNSLDWINGTIFGGK